MTPRRTVAVTLLLVAALLAPTTAAASVIGSPEIDLYADDNRVTPGQEARLGVTVLNTGDIDVGGPVPGAEQRVTTARGLTLSLRSGGAPISVESGTVAVGTVPEGAVPAAFSISVNEDADPGTYRLPVRVQYAYTESISEQTGAHDQDTVDTTMYVRVVVNADARFAVVDSATTAAPGGDGDVSLTLKNVGSDPANNATLSVQSRNAGLTFGGSPSAQAFAGDWAANATRTFDFESTLAPGTEQRPLALSASVAYENADGEARSSGSLSAGVVPADEQSFGLAGTSATLRVGEDGTLNATVSNDGPRAVENAVLVLEPSGGPISATESEYALGDLSAGASATASYDLAVSSAADAGARQFTLRVRYQDDDGDTRRSDPLYARATVEPERDQFDVAPVDATLNAGDAGEFTVEVTNTGDRPVTDVSAKLFADSPVSAGDAEAFVARLGPGETTTLAFGVSIAGSARPKTYPVSMDFRYEDADGDTLLTDTYRLPVEVTEPESGGGGILPFSIAGVGAGSLGAAALIGYLARRD